MFKNPILDIIEKVVGKMDKIKGVADLENSAAPKDKLEEDELEMEEKMADETKALTQEMKEWASAEFENMQMIDRELSETHILQFIAI